MMLLKKLYFLIFNKRHIRLSLCKVEIIEVLSIKCPIIDFLSIFNVNVLILLFSVNDGYFGSSSFRIMGISFVMVCANKMVSCCHFNEFGCLRGVNFQLF